LAGAIDLTTAGCKISTTTLPMSSSAYLMLALASVTASCSFSAPNGDAGAGQAAERELARPRVDSGATVGSDQAGMTSAAGATSASGAVSTAGKASASGSTAGGASPAPDCSPHDVVLTPHLSNARDLAGTLLSPSGAVACGAVFRGPPLSLTQDGCTAAAELGIRTVLDLRTESERLGTPDSSCVDAKRVFAPLPVPYGLGPNDYLNDLHATSSIAIAFHTFGDADAYPIYFHCTFGRDRTGIVGALLLLTLGASRDTVMQEYLLSGPNVGAYPKSLNAVLDEVEQRGGAEAVLKDAGITADELAVMRSRMTVD
jgi:protein-tyrosine phosphatase